ncbi:hypothetical protein Cgig2_013152 [Carnegiea gigantea]|uniref:Cytochrome P450 n=1 Tax=Carnegiea gigantea TaxID=171969 RepID=A0A9Q1QP97_9CARY|nr:hypothetical protein Cgig2_013152 [Carnegiea gigantea]
MVYFLMKLIKEPSSFQDQKPWPIIGNIHLLGSKPRRSVANLSKTYGPLMSLRLGSITTIVISSPDVAKEVFFKHDLAFASRHVPDAIRILGHIDVLNGDTSGRSRPSSYYPTNDRMPARDSGRRKSMSLLSSQRVVVKKALPLILARLRSQPHLTYHPTHFSIYLSSYDSLGSREFKDLVWHMMEEGARPNVSDFSPLLRPLDLQGARKGLVDIFAKY